MGTYDQIDWEELRIFYNKTKNTTFKTLKEMFTALYWGDRIGCNKIGDVFGVSHASVYNEIKRHGIKFRDRSQNNTRQDDAFLAIPESEMREMTRRQIRIRLGWGASTVDDRLTKYSREFRTIRGDRRRRRRKNVPR